MAALIKNKILLFSFMTSFLLLVIAFSFIYVKFSDTQHLLIIHFDSFSGIDFLGAKQEVYGILLAGLAINVINGLLAVVFYFKERFFSYLLSFFNILVSLLILAVIMVIVSIN